MLRRLTLAIAYEQLTGSLRGFELAAAERLLALVAAGPGKADFIGGLVGELVADRLYVYRPTRYKISRSVPLPGKVEIQKLHFRISAEILAAGSVSDRELRRGRDVVYLDRRRVKTPLRIRSLRRGDRFRPLGLKGSKKLSDFLVDRKIDRPLREELLVVEDAEKIIWIAGLEIAEDAKVDSGTQKLVKLELMELADD